MAFTKDPDDYLDYGIDWSVWLGEDTIIASTWAVEPDDDTLTTSAPTFDATNTTIWIADGTAGSRYKVINHITTTAGRQKDRALQITVKEV